MKTKEKQYYLRKCDSCNKGMSGGYIVHDGNYYFCSYECGEKHLGNKRIFTTLEDWNNDGPGLTWGEFQEYLEKNENKLSTKEIDFAYDECSWSEWFIGDDWGYLFDEQGEEIDTEEVQEENIIEGIKKTTTNFTMIKFGTGLMVVLNGLLKIIGALFLMNKAKNTT